MLVGLATLLVIGFRPETHPKGVIFALLTGITGILGSLFFFQAAQKGKISVVVSITAIYPLITPILAIAAILLMTT